MNLAAAPKTLIALALLATAACAAPTEDQGEAEEVDGPIGETSSALSCQPTITGAAITKQIVSVEEPTTLTVELVTVSPKPFKHQATSLTFPAGFLLQSIGTTSCGDSGSSYRCRHQAVLLAAGATSGTGAYSMRLTGMADLGTGCASGATQNIDFSLTTESFETTSVDGSGMAGVALYGDANYSGWGVPFDAAGAWSFVDKLQGLNDQVSSVRVDRGWKVTLYEHANFTGRTTVITADTPFVGGFNDLTSAIVVSKL